MIRPALVYPSETTRPMQSITSSVQRVTSSDIRLRMFPGWLRLRLGAGLVGVSIAIAAFTGSPAQGQTLVATLPSGPNPVAVAVNQTTNMVYVADVDVRTLTVIDGATNTATTIPAVGPLASVAVNPRTNTIYALNGGSQSSGLGGIVVTPGYVSVINGATNAVTATIPLPALGTRVVVNPATDQIYISALNEIGNGAVVDVLVIDGSTNAITTTISIPQIIGSLAVDTTRNVIYAMYENAPGNATVAAIDGSTNAVTATVQVGYNDNSFALNETTNTIYVPDPHGNQLYGIDGATLAITTTIPWPDTLLSNGLAVNPVTNTIYVTSNNGSYVVQAVNGVTNTITASISDPYYPAFQGLMANSVTNKIWQISNPVVVIDGAANTVTSVAGTSGTVGALNTVTNYAYIAAPNNVFVISGTPAGPAFSASPNPLAFGNQTEDTASAAKTLTVTNTGTSDLTITTVTAGGTNKADFIVGTDTCANATVSAGKTCSLSIEFAPSTTTAESATLTFADNASGSPQAVTLTGTGVAPVATASTTALTASATSVAIGTSVTFTATVSPAAGTPTPTGSVTFKDGSITLGTGTLNSSGVATYTASSLAEGSHSVAASYGGDSRNLSSASTAVAVTVTAASSTTTLTASAPSVIVGASVTFTATVTGGSGANAPTGTVTFKDGTTTLSTGTLNASGMATYATSALAAGSHSVTANYAGDTNNAASVSSSVAVAVWPGPPNFTMALSPGSGSFKAGTPAAITITVTSVNGFNAATTLTCSGLPKNTTCTFSSPNITPTVSGMATSTLTIATDVKATSATLASENSRSARRSPLQHPITIAGALAAFLVLPLLGAKNRKLRKLLLTVGSTILIATIASLGMAGCGGGPTTAKGTYAIQVVGTAGSLSQSATYSLTVQ